MEAFVDGQKMGSLGETELDGIYGEISFFEKRAKSTLIASVIEIIFTKISIINICVIKTAMSFCYKVTT